MFDQKTYDINPLACQEEKYCNFDDSTGHFKIDLNRVMKFTDGRSYVVKMNKGLLQRQDKLESVEDETWTFSYRVIPGIYSGLSLIRLLLILL